MTSDRPTLPPAKPPPPDALITDEDARLLITGAHPDPFAVLGPTTDGHGLVVYIPGAAGVNAVNNTQFSALSPRPGAPGVFCGPILPFYRLQISWPGIGDGPGSTEEREDPYRFGPVIGPVDEHLLGQGTHHRLWEVLGAHVLTHEGAHGVHFAVWAPNAQRVSVVGDHNAWDATAHPMRPRGATGVWELFLPGLDDGAVYKYDILDATGQTGPQKADPVGFGAERAPATGSVVRRLGTHHWLDTDWMRSRPSRSSGVSDNTAPISIFEVHLGSWRRHADGTTLSYREFAVELVDYVVDLGFTHIEILPVSEYPFDGSWGYQPVGLYAPTNRYGTPADFAAFVDAAHQRGIAVLADWVPGHFPTDAHGLAKFDGTALYEHLDPRRGFHPDWTTLIFNYGRPEVANYLTANARYWLDEYHLDGLRVDAVSSVVYRDYSRRAGEWLPNEDGGRENYEGIDVLRETTAATADYPGTIMVAEESTTFPGVTALPRKDRQAGLGFDYKWNLGWMNDSLTYFGRDPLFRRYHPREITFGITYAFSEKFVLPISHDEVVHGKGSMYGRMPGNHRERLANLRAFYGYMWGYPGKKLLFMGTEFGQVAEWNFAGQLEWNCLDDDGHIGVLDLVRDLNRIYRTLPALHRRDGDANGFQWLIVNAETQIPGNGDEVFAWLRRGAPGDQHVVVVCNLTAVERHDHRVPFPLPGGWTEILNTDSRFYAGLDRGNAGRIETEPIPAGTEAQSALLTLPPLSTLYFVEEQS